MLLSAEKSVLLVIDVQERLAPAMDDPRRVIDGASRLAGAASFLSVPVGVAELRPKKHGPTMFDVRTRLPDMTPFVRETFSCAADKDAIKALTGTTRSQVVLCGVEFHVAVLQTALDLKAQGFDVFVAADASSSKTLADETLAAYRMRDAGIIMTSVEMIFYEWLRRGGTPEFETVSQAFFRQ